MGGVVSARKAQYFEPRYEGDKKPSARVAPGRTGSDIFPDKKASAPAAAAAPSHKGVRTKPRNRSIVGGREPLGLFEPKGPHFHKEPVVDKSWNSVPVGQSLPGYFSQPY